MGSVRSLIDLLERVVSTALWLGFAALIVTVGLQVLARNVFQVPMIWTLDLAQLLFAWLIFIGAAIAYRRGAHYRIDMLPPGWSRASLVLNVVGVVTSVVVIYVLVRYGWFLTALRWRSEVQALGISQGWFYISIPVSGALMGLFLAEAVASKFFPAREGRGEGQAVL